MIGKRIFLSVFVLFFVLTSGTNGWAQGFPTKTIRMINPYASGGGGSTLARAFQTPFKNVLGTSVIVEDIPGGTTKIGTLEVMKANPDGYTLLFMADPAWVGYYYSKTYDFKPWEKLTAVGNLTVEPYGFIEIRSDAPYGSWAELVKYGKENPGKLTCGGPGAGGVPELIFNMITKAAGISGKYVPFAGAGPSKTALLGGHIDFRVCQHTEAISMIRAGKTKGIAISSDKRMEILPNVPTFKELGIGESIILTRSIWGPPQLPSSIVNILAAAIAKGIKDPEFIKVAEQGLFYKTEFRLGPRMIEELEKFDKTFGPQLAALYE